MNYKKIAIYISLTLIAAVLCGTGFWVGRSGNTEGQKVHAAPDEQKEKESVKIAVVNLDEGVPQDGSWVNYAEELSRFPSMDFEYSSLEAARTGLKTGKYGAYVIIPAVFSQNVESINTIPQVSQLEYAVDHSCSGRRQYELLYNVWSYIDSLNSRLSYMYVDNILREFHDAQDGAERVMENDQRDMAAMDRIMAQDLVALQKIPEMPLEEAMPETLDISGFTARSCMLEETLDKEYESALQGIRNEVDSLSADGAILSKRLEELAGQASKINITVDGNGEDIAKKAEDELRSELERQSENMLKKEEISRCLRELYDNTEKIIEESGQSEGDGQSSQDMEFISRLSEQNQELDSVLAEIDRAEDLDSDRIAELVRTEYVGRMESNVEEVEKAFQQRYEEEIGAVLAYNVRLADFHPQENRQFLAQSIQELKENHRSMQGALAENNEAHIQYALSSFAASREYAERLQVHLAEVQKASEEAVKEGLDMAKEVKEKSSAMNRGILGDFTSKLPYTRLGSAEHTHVYQFIANPLSAADRSVKQVVEEFF